MKAGVCYKGNGRCSFTVWAPLLESVQLKILSPAGRLVPMENDGKGYWEAEVKDVYPGGRYLYRLGGEKERPDPASRSQPDGVHAPSQLEDPSAFPWRDDAWKGLPLRDCILYELHVGTFTREGTFDAVATRLDYLKELGVTAVELMPVAQFPGTRNWGYDGVYPFAVQNSYGGPAGLMRLVDACHRKELAVVLDVVYNHLGPEGNYLRDYAPYFTDRYRTPWGDAINFDGPYSDDVREYFIGSALSWVTDYHVDALRIDAIHGIYDFSARHFLQELGEAVHDRARELGRQVYVIPESDLNDVRVINPVDAGGYGLDAQWNDDFHHALHTLLTGERQGYYRDFGKIEHLEKAFREGFVYSGQYSEFRKRRHGSSSKDRPMHQFVVFSQNHDQVGNRMKGERLSSLASFEQLKLAAGTVLLSPFLPLLFMGEEYGESAPFLYFVSHSDPGLIEAVRRGRKEEFSRFGWNGEPPDPQDERTFRASRLHWEDRATGLHEVLLQFYKRLIALRRETPALREPGRDRLAVQRGGNEKVLEARRWSSDGTSHIYVLLNFGADDASFRISSGPWRKILDSADASWQGPGEMLPGTAGNGDRVMMRGHSISVYGLTAGT